MKNVLLLAKESGRTLLEIFAQVPGSFREYQAMIRDALSESPPTEIADADYCYIEGCIGNFPEKVIFEAVWWDKEKATKYFQADVSRGENDKVLFSNITEVEIKAAITAKNEMRKLEESDSPDNKKLTEFNETMSADVELESVDEAQRGKRKRKGSVATAQQADMRNENGRFYPAAVLKEAVEEVQDHLPLMMDSQHRVNAQGEPENNIRETVALIKSVEFNEATGTVTLPEIEFVETQAGKDLMELLDSGAKLNVSQRGIGSSHTVVNQQTGDTHEEIDFLRIKSFDFVPRGQSGVKDAAFEGLTEGAQNRQTEPTPEQSRLTEGGNAGNAGGDPNAGNAGGNPNTNGNDNGNSQTEQIAALSEEDRALLEQGVQQGQQTAAAVNILENQLQESRNAIEETTRKQKIAHLKQVGDEILEIEVGELDRFNDDQKNSLSVGSILSTSMNVSLMFIPLKPSRWS